MIELEDSVFIHQPVTKVFEYVTNFENNAQWQTGIVTSEVTSAEPIGRGSTYSCVNRFLGLLFESEGIIAEFKPNRICSYRFTSGSVCGESSFVFESVNGGTKFTTRGKLKLKNLKLAAFWVNRKARQQVRHDLQRLKRILENGRLAISAG
jgi:uncharacterized membrane protein